MPGPEHRRVRADPAGPGGADADAPGTDGVAVSGGGGRSDRGHFLGGRVRSRAGASQMGLAQLDGGCVLFVVVPLLPWFGLVLAVVGVQGWPWAHQYRGEYLLIWTHGANVGPYKNGLHFCFGLGRVGLPLLVAQVIPLAGTGGPIGRWQP